MNLLRIPEREETPIFIIANRRKAFTVLGLICMRAAISLLAKPSTRNRTASPSRCERWYLSQILSMSAPASEPRSRRSAHEDPFEPFEPLPGSRTQKKTAVVVPPSGYKLVANGDLTVGPSVCDYRANL